MKAKIKSTGKLVDVLKYYTTNNGINPDDLTHRLSILLEDGNMKEVAPSEIQLMDCNEEFILLCNTSKEPVNAILDMDYVVSIIISKQK